jgi:hypothetical protein
MAKRRRRRRKITFFFVIKKNEKGNGSEGREKVSVIPSFV